MKAADQTKEGRGERWFGNFALPGQHPANEKRDPAFCEIPFLSRSNGSNTPPLCGVKSACAECFLTHLLYIEGSRDMLHAYNLQFWLDIVWKIVEVDRMSARFS